MFVFSRRAFAFAGIAVLLAACNAAQSSIPSGTPTQPRLRAAGSKITASPAKLNFTTKPALKIAVSEKGYTGAFTLTVSPAGLVKIKPAKAKGPAVTLTVTAVDAGKGTLSISDASGNSVAVAVTITKGVIVIQ